jgi:hypothetical protein
LPFDCEQLLRTGGSVYVQTIVCDFVWTETFGIDAFGIVVLSARSISS